MRADISLSRTSIPCPSPLIIRNLLMMSLTVSSSSTCSVTNHCRKISVAKSRSSLARCTSSLIRRVTSCSWDRPVAVKGPGASTALINTPLQMTHHLLSARRVKGQLRRPGSCSESPLSNVHDHETYSRYHYISMIPVCWGCVIH